MPEISGLIMNVEILESKNNELTSMVFQQLLALVIGELVHTGGSQKL